MQTIAKPVLLTQAGTNDEARRILKGKEYLTVFSGDTGEALHTIDYIPARGNVARLGRTQKVTEATASWLV